MSFLIKLNRHPFLNTDCQRELGPSGKYCVTDAKKRSHVDDGRDKSRRFSLSSSCAVFLSNTPRPKPAGTKLLSPANIITICILVIKLARRSEGALTFRHRASCILGQAFHCSPENAFYIFNHKYISLSDICLTVHH